MIPTQPATRRTSRRAFGPRAGEAPPSQQKVDNVSLHDRLVTLTHQLDVSEQWTDQRVARLEAQHAALVERLIAAERPWWVTLKVWLRW